MSKMASVGNLSTSLPIISATERLSRPRYITGCIFGEYGVGKTSLLWTLDPGTTLFVDLEAGDLAVEGWMGDTIRPKSWNECRDLAVYIGLWNDAIANDRPYSRAHFDAVCLKYGVAGTSGNSDASDTHNSFSGKYKTIFIDSITVAGRMCLAWCKSQPQSFSEKTGKQDLRAVYGLHGREMIDWLSHLQHARNCNIWFVGILEKKEDDLGRRYYAPQIDGAKCANELPGIVDQVITMAYVGNNHVGSGGKNNSIYHRAFINHTNNPYGYPAKDRSGRLDSIEPAHLGQLMEKINSPLSNENDGSDGSAGNERFNYDLPNSSIGSNRVSDAVNNLNNINNNNKEKNI